MKVTIALCTRERPMMLAKCLRSIQSLKIPNSCNLHVVLIENGETPSCEMDARSQMSRTPEIGFTYQIERKLGIASARNTSVDVALSTKPDWIAFIDDDEVVSEDWLLNYKKAMEIETADVFTGPVERILMDEAPIWYKKPAILNYDNLSKLDCAATNNSIARADFFDGKQNNLRFDESCNFSGGEDTKLFHTLFLQGGTICFVKNAIVFEYRTEERTSKKWLIKGNYFAGNLNARMRIESNSRWNAISIYSSKLTSNLFHGSLYVIWGGLAYPFSKRSIRYIVKGLVKLSWFAGFCTGLLNVAHEQYKDKIEGC